MLFDLRRGHLALFFLVIVAGCSEQPYGRYSVHITESNFAQAATGETCTLAIHEGDSLSLVIGGGTYPYTKLTSKKDLPTWYFEAVTHNTGQVWSRFEFRYPASPSAATTAVNVYRLAMEFDPALETVTLRTARSPAAASEPCAATSEEIAKGVVERADEIDRQCNDVEDCNPYGAVAAH